MQPDALGEFTGVGVEFDADGRTHQFRRRDVEDEPFGHRSNTERNLVDPVEGRLEVDHHIQVSRGSAWGDGPRIAAARQRMQACSGGAEPRCHIVGGQSGEITERADAEPAQQGDDRRCPHRSLLVVEQPDAEWREKVGRMPGLHHMHTIVALRTGSACRLVCREDPVGDADPGPACPLVVCPAGEEETGGQFATVILSSATHSHSAQPRPQHLNTGNEGFESRDDGFERPIIEGGVVVEHHEIGVHGLRLAQSQAPPDPLDARRGG